MKLKNQLIIGALIGSFTVAANAASDVVLDHNHPQERNVATFSTSPQMNIQNMKANQNGFNGMPMDMGRMNMAQNGNSGMPMNMNNMQMDMNSMPMNMNGMNMNNMPMNGMSNYGAQMPMNMGQNQMPYAGNNNSRAMPMMKMMQQKSQAMRQHQQKVEAQLTNINNSLQQLIVLQKAK